MDVYHLRPRRVEEAAFTFLGSRGGSSLSRFTGTKVLTTSIQTTWTSFLASIGGVTYWPLSLYEGWREPVPMLRMEYSLFRLPRSALLVGEQLLTRGHQISLGISVEKQCVECVERTPNWFILIWRFWRKRVKLGNQITASLASECNQN